jgi:hypothetical protein
VVAVARLADPVDLVVAQVVRADFVPALVVVLALVGLVLVGPVDLVVLVDSALALVVLVPGAPVALVAHAPAALVVLVLVVHLVLVAVLAPEAVLVDLVLVALVVALVLVEVLVAQVDRATVSVAHLARSHVHVAGVSSMNCSRSSRATPTAMLLFLKAPFSSSGVGQPKSLLRS